MGRFVIGCLFLFALTLNASARPSDQDVHPGRFFTDFLTTENGRFCEGDQYSRFPGQEAGLKLCPQPRRDSPDIIYTRAAAVPYTVQPGDTLRKIARNHGTTIELIQALNRMRNDRLRAGRRLWLWDKPFTIEINKTLNRLTLRTGHKVIKEYPVSTGRSTDQTPLGIFFIHSRYPYPTWFHKGDIVPGGSAENFLGSRWLGFDKPQFGLHGTIFPELIGRSVSKGCVRMRNEDIEELYEFIPVGTMVMITQ